MATKQDILDRVDTSAINFSYYDRKEDEQVNADDLINAVKDGTVTIEELAAEFERCLRNYLK